jgi:hypothetical protein
VTYDNRNTFIFGRNERKEKDAHPDFTGTLTDGDGREFWMSAWVKEKNGKKFFTGSLKAKEERRESVPEPQRRASLKDQLNDDIPFAPEWR